MILRETGATAQSLPDQVSCIAFIDNPSLPRVDAWLLFRPLYRGAKRLFTRSLLRGRRNLHAPNSELVMRDWPVEAGNIPLPKDNSWKRLGHL